MFHASPNGGLCMGVAVGSAVGGGIGVVVGSTIAVGVGVMERQAISPRNKPVVMEKMEKMENRSKFLCKWNPLAAG